MIPNTSSTKEIRVHQHGEAFMHMQYVSKDSRKRIYLTIWNSRDGVTPFMTYCAEYGVELQHVNWGQDSYDPNYKPRKGDLIWRSMTKEDAEEMAKKQIEMWLKEKKRLEEMTDEDFKKSGMKDFDRQGLIEQLSRMTTNPEDHIKTTIHECLENGEPHLELVKENWL